MTLAAARQSVDDIVHSPVRLTIMCALASADSADYQTLKDALDVSHALLSKHAAILEDAGYLVSDKPFRGKTPQTHFRLTRVGRAALAAHLETLDEMMRGLASA